MQAKCCYLLDADHLVLLGIFAVNRFQYLYFLKQLLYVDYVVKFINYKWYTDLISDWITGMTFLKI